LREALVAAYGQPPHDLDGAGSEIPQRRLAAGDHADGIALPACLGHADGKATSTMARQRHTAAAASGATRSAVMTKSTVSRDRTLNMRVSRRRNKSASSPRVSQYGLGSRSWVRQYGSGWLGRIAVGSSV
jgi:hypothetical protein